MAFFRTVSFFQYKQNKQCFNISLKMILFHRFMSQKLILNNVRKSPRFNKCKGFKIMTGREWKFDNDYFVVAIKFLINFSQLN